MFYTYFYNHARRLRLEKYYIYSFLEAPSPSGHFKVLLDPGTAVSELKRPLRNRFGSETVLILNRFM